MATDYTLTERKRKLSDEENTFCTADEYERASKTRCTAFPTVQRSLSMVDDFAMSVQAPSATSSPPSWAPLPKRRNTTSLPHGIFPESKYDQHSLTAPLESYPKICLYPEMPTPGLELDSPSSVSDADGMDVDMNDSGSNHRQIQDCSLRTPPDSPTFHSSLSASVSASAPHNFLLSHPHQVAHGFKHNSSACTQIPRLQIANHPGLDGKRAMYSHCVQCGAITKVD